MVPDISVVVVGAAAAILPPPVAASHPSTSLSAIKVSCNKQTMKMKILLKVNILANSTWSGLLSYFQGIKIKRFTKW
jgi:hypothetical protein